MKYDVGIVGVPSDIGASSGGGQSKAPSAIRQGLVVAGGYDPYHDVNTSQLTVHDFGDVDVVPVNQFETMSAACKLIAKAVNKSQRVCVLGGDDTVSYMAIDGLNQAGITPTLIHFDAHCDYFEWSHGELDHATWVREVHEMGMVKNVFQYGVRAMQYDDVKFPFVRKAKDLLRRCPLNSPVFLAIDLDVLDPAYAPAVTCQEAGGMSTRELLNLVFTLSSTRNVKGISITELLPDKDFDGRTVAVAQRLVRTFVSASSV